jgi:EAL domain-containing protein (putative c-di-GMP-specific phosphodiesterase class I)
MPTQSGGRVLILEDDPGVGRVIDRVATADGHHARVETQPEPFFAALADWQPTHIVLDLVMPEMDGIQILSELGARHCTANIIITSGMGTQVLDAARRAAHAHGLHVVGLLAKPFSPAALRALIAVPPGSPGDFKSRLLDDFAPGPELSEAEFRFALENKEIQVHYQPKVNCLDGALVGFEALARWVRPGGPLIMPDQFVALAEKTGLVDELTIVVLDQALAWFCPRFVDSGAASYVAPGTDRPSDISLSINLSASSLHDRRLVDRIAATCADHQMPAASLIFELTETSAMKSPAAALEMLTRMRVKGFQLSIDDFGIGHSSMRQLVRMPFTEIKVDKSFVISASHSTESRTIVKSMVGLGRSLGLKSVAEGVEDAQTFALLRKMGCDFAQGYAIGRPMAGDAVADWMARERLQA